MNQSQIATVNFKLLNLNNVNNPWVALEAWTRKLREPCTPNWCLPNKSKIFVSESMIFWFRCLRGVIADNEQNIKLIAAKKLAQLVQIILACD